MGNERHTTIAVLMNKITDTVCSDGEALQPSTLRASDFPTMGNQDGAHLVDPRCAAFLPTKPPSPDEVEAFRVKVDGALLAMVKEDIDAAAMGCWRAPKGYSPPQPPYLTPEMREELARCIDPFPPIVDQYGRPAREPFIGSLPWGGPFILAGRADDE